MVVFYSYYVIIAIMMDSMIFDAAKVALSSQVQREDMGMLAHGFCPGSAATAGRHRGYVLSGVCPGRVELLRFFIPWGKPMVSIGK